MRTLFFIILSCLFSTQVFAFGATGMTFGVTINAINNTATNGTTKATDASTDGSKKLSKKDKVIKQAKNDATAFVGSQGLVRGVYLEEALQHIRQNYKLSSQVSDLELAQAILSY